ADLRLAGAGEVVARNAAGEQQLVDELVHPRPRFSRPAPAPRLAGHRPFDVEREVPHGLDCTPAKAGVQMFFMEESGLADVTQQLGEPRRRHVELPAAGDPLELDHPELVATLLVLADVARLAA